MKSLFVHLILLLTTSCGLFSYSSTTQNITMELYGNFHTMGITISIADTDDPDQNAVATVEYRQGVDPYRTGFPLTRTGPTRFVGSLFWLDPGKPTSVRVTFQDPDGDPLNGAVLEATSSTRAEIIVPRPQNQLIVSPAGSGAACSLAAPCALLMGISRAQPGDAVLLRGGVYYRGEILLFRPGKPDAPIIIRSYPGEEAVLDGADPTPRTWTALGGGVYYSDIELSDTKLVAVNGLRLYPYADLAALQDLSWQIPGFYMDGQRLYIHLEGDADPNGASIVISRYNRGFNVKTDYIYFLDLTFRHFGQENESRALYFNAASHNLVQGSTFFLNNGGITIQGVSQRNVVQDNDFSDTLFRWSWDALKEIRFLERGGVYFGNPPGGRGNIIRRNAFHDYFDGLDVCSGEPAEHSDEIDVYDNLMYLIGDDGLQVDGWCSNVRIWNNRFHDVLVGISFAPTVGGPAYAIRNLIYRYGVGNNDHDGRSFKFNSNSGDRSGAVYLLHNTADAATPNPHGFKISSGSSDGWQLIYARNNIWVSKGVALRNDNIDLPVDLDYNNLWSRDGRELVRWNDIEYVSLPAFRAATGQEPHGFNLSPGFVDVQLDDYRLDPTSSMIDAGVLIPGINDIHFGAAPDLGAIESTATATNQVHLPAVRRP